MAIPAFLIPESTIQKNATGESIELPDFRPVLVTLGILKVIEQESLIVSVEGSEDGSQWLPDPLVTFPEKFYPGVSAVYVDPAAKNVRFLRATWKVNRWGRGDKTPSFQIYLFAETV